MARFHTHEIRTHHWRPEDEHKMGAGTGSRTETRAMSETETGTGTESETGKGTGIERKRGRKRALVSTTSGKKHNRRPDTAVPHVASSL